MVIVDDQELFRAGLRTVLGTRRGITVVGEASNGEEALRVCTRLRPDVVLMDLKMPILDGVAATRRIRASCPECKMLALTTFDDDELVFEALRAGVLGYLLKDAPSDQLVEAIQVAARGETFLVPSVATKVVMELVRTPQTAKATDDTSLSARERDVLRLVARGSSNKEIAVALSVAEGTVKNHLTSILAKLKVGDRTQAALRARELGIT